MYIPENNHFIYLILYMLAKQNEGKRFSFRFFFFYEIGDERLLGDDEYFYSILHTQTHAQTHSIQYNIVYIQIYCIWRNEYNSVILTYNIIEKLSAPTSLTLSYMKIPLILTFKLDVIHHSKLTTELIVTNLFFIENNVNLV